MITHLEGELREAQPTRVVIDVAGVGYECVIPLSSFDRLPRSGARVSILTHLHLRDDGLVLFGLLISVSGIGPKIAIGILSGISPRNFRAAVREGNAAALSAVPGIGKKKAERLILELKDRVEAFEEGEPGVPAAGRAENDAAMALVSLGYSQAEAARAVHAAAKRIGKAADAETLIREALKAAN